MVKAGKIVASIFSGLAFLCSVGMIAYMMYLSHLGHSLERSAEKGLIDLDPEALHTLEHLADGSLEREFFGEFRRHGIIGAITSFITFIACFITLPNKKFLFPAIATGSAVIGAIFCGWLIMSFLLVAVGGIGLIVFSHYLADKNAEQST